MRGWLGVIAIVYATGVARGDDPSWAASVPLWKSLSSDGDIIDAGPAPGWASPPPAATISRILPMSRPAPVGTLRPHELPEDLVGGSGPKLPNPVVAKPVFEASKRGDKESFASERVEPAGSQSQPSPPRFINRPIARIFLPRR